MGLLDLLARLLPGYLEYPLLLVGLSVQLVLLGLSLLEYLELRFHLLIQLLLLDLLVRLLPGYLEYLLLLVGLSVQLDLLGLSLLVILVDQLLLALLVILEVLVFPEYLVGLLVRLDQLPL